MSILQKSLHGIVTLTICMSMAIPYQIFANCDEPCAVSCNYPPCFATSCVPEKSSINPNILWGAGGFLLGTGVGIGIGYGIWNNNHRHKNHSCNRGCSLKPARETQLTFISQIYFIGYFDEAVPLNTPVEFTLFAVSPNGLITPSTTTSTLYSQYDGDYYIEDYTNDTITITSQCCGNYQLGYTVSSDYGLYELYPDEGQITLNLEGEQIGIPFIYAYYDGGVTFTDAQFIIADYVNTNASCIAHPEL